VNTVFLQRKIEGRPIHIPPWKHHVPQFGNSYSKGLSTPWSSGRQTVGFSVFIGSHNTFCLRLHGT